jgi:hypothetical protein
VLEDMGLLWLPFHKTWRLNERMCVAQRVHPTPTPQPTCRVIVLMLSTGTAHCKASTKSRCACIARARCRSINAGDAALQTVDKHGAEMVQIWRRWHAQRP